jgi:hypothetical protein
VTKVGERCKLVMGVREVSLGAIRHESSFSSSSTHIHELVARQSRLDVDNGRELRREKRERREIEREKRDREREER